MGGLHVGDPVADRLTGGVFEGGRPCGDGLHSGPQQAHPEHIQGLAAHIFSAHIHHTFQAETGADRGGSHTMLTGTGFSNDPLFTHAQSEESLTQGVVDLVGAGVIQVFTLEPDARTTISTAVVLG